MTEEKAPPNTDRIHDLRPITVALIEVPEGRRPARAARIEALKQNIDVSGLIHPILVVQQGQKYRLLAGRQRLEAVRALRWVEIPATVLPESTPIAEQRFAEIMENINREDLTKLERADHLAALKENWEQMNPAARNGGDRRSANVRLVKDAEKEQQNHSAILALCSDMAEEVGLSRRSFFRAIEISKGVHRSVKMRIGETWIAKHQATLEGLAKVDLDTQMLACDALLSNPPHASTIADALMIAEGRTPPKDEDKNYQRVTATWSRLSTKSKRAFIDQHKADFLAHAKKQGWTL